MNINKLKIMLIVICCFIASLFSEAQCMEDINDKPTIRSHQLTLIPAGSIMAFAGETPPDGWLLCDGKEQNSIEYPELYKVIKLKYVPANEELRVLRFNNDNDKKLFYVPDLRGRVIIGVDSGGIRVTSNNTIGASGGEEKHQLLESELAPHVHLLKTIRGHAPAGNTNWFQVPHLDNPEYKFDPHYSGSSGAGEAHNNMQPYQVLNYIINAGNLNNRAEPYKLQNEINQLKERIHSLEIYQQKYESIFSGETQVSLKNVNSNNERHQYLDGNRDNGSTYLSPNTGCSGTHWSLKTIQ